MSDKKRCCDKPNFEMTGEKFEKNYAGTRIVIVRIYQCQNCGVLEEVDGDEQSPKWN